MENKEIVKKFIDSKAVNFDAIGALVKDLGPALAVDTKVGYRIVLSGCPFIIACLMPAGTSENLSANYVTLLI
jgi:hypothetical protein